MAAKKRRKRRRKGAPPRGYGALKSIEGGDLLEIRRVLHGSPPVDLARKSEGDIRDRLHKDETVEQDKLRAFCALMFMRWRHWSAQRDDCEKRIEAGKGDKWTRKLLKRSEREINEAWRDLGGTLSAMSDAQLHEQMAILCKAARPAVYAWQKAATERIIAQQGIDNVRLSEGKVEPENAQWLLANVRRVNLTARQLNKHLREQGHTMTQRSVSRFVLGMLQVTLRSERGKRTDLNPRWKRRF